MPLPLVANQGTAGISTGNSGSVTLNVAASSSLWILVLQMAARPTVSSVTVTGGAGGTPTFAGSVASGPSSTSKSTCVSAYYLDSQTAASGVVVGVTAPSNFPWVILVLNITGAFVPSLDAVGSGTSGTTYGGAFESDQVPASSPSDLILFLLCTGATTTSAAPAWSFVTPSGNAFVQASQSATFETLPGVYEGVGAAVYLMPAGATGPQTVSGAASVTGTSLVGTGFAGLAIALKPLSTFPSPIVDVQTLQSPVTFGTPVTLPPLVVQPGGMVLVFLNEATAEVQTGIAVAGTNGLGNLLGIETGAVPNALFSCGLSAWGAFVISPTANTTVLSVTVSGPGSAAALVAVAISLAPTPSIGPSGSRVAYGVPFATGAAGTGSEEPLESTATTINTNPPPESQLPVLGLLAVAAIGQASVPVVGVDGPLLVLAGGTFPAQIVPLAFNLVLSVGYTVKPAFGLNTYSGGVTAPTDGGGAAAILLPLGAQVAGPSTTAVFQTGIRPGGSASSSRHSAPST